MIAEAKTPLETSLELQQGRTTRALGLPGDPGRPGGPPAYDRTGSGIGQEGTQAYSEAGTGALPQDRRDAENEGGRQALARGGIIPDFCHVRKWRHAIQCRSTGRHRESTDGKDQKPLPQLRSAKQASTVARSIATVFPPRGKSRCSRVALALERDPGTHERPSTTGADARATPPNAARNADRTSTVRAPLCSDDLHELRLYGNVQCSHPGNRERDWHPRSGGATCLTKDRSISIFRREGLR